MSDESAPPPADNPPPPAASAPPPAYGSAPPAHPYGVQPLATTGPVGTVRSTGTCILLFIVTLGFYGLYWYFKSHDEMKRYSGEGIGGGLALLIGFFLGVVMAFLSPMEVGKLYERRGQPAPVSALTGLWILLPLLGVIVWFVKTNGALNDYWRSAGAS
jgi:Zn-dependent protease